MDETEEIIRLCGRAIVAQMGETPGFELLMVRNCVLALTGEPTADSNRLIMGPSPDAEAFFSRAIARANERGLPLTAVMPPDVEQTLAPLATQLGLTRVGGAPLMVLRAGTPVQPGRPVKVTRALGPKLVRIAGDLVAAAFDEPRDLVARTIDVCITQTGGVETWIAWDDEAPISVVSVTPTGDTAAITCMGTPPAHQRQGMGRALLTQVMTDYRRRGVTRFHLGATQAGLPLYASLGFETIAELSAWVLS
jgi:GNAT superfamily N-acetyltransferase